MRQLAALSLLTAGAAFGAVTYSKDVAPILQKNCEGCHRSGEAAPMSLRNYKEVRPYAAAIKEAVLLKKMPPWLADPHYGHFSNDRSLSEQDIKTLAAWADSGAKEGDPAELPKPKEFLTGWNIQKPDLQIQMAEEFHVPAKGTLDYQYITIKGNFEKDTWVSQAEVRPGNRSVIHHVIAFVRGPGEKGTGEYLVGYAPGETPLMLATGRAKLIRAGSDIVLQVHYTANGKETTDRSTVGFVFAKGPVNERVYTLAATTARFAIPAGDPNYKVDSAFEFGGDATIVSLHPHMHLRGKDFEYRAVYPTGETETLLSVPNYSFAWQLVYYPVKELSMPKGTKIECTAHYDNSPNNPNNPDPTKIVKYGDQSWDEMMFGFFDVAFDAKLPLTSILPERRKPSAE